MNCRSRSTGHSACSKSLKISFDTITASIAVEKCTLQLRCMSRSLKQELLVKVNESQCELKEYAEDHHGRLYKF